MVQDLPELSMLLSGVVCLYLAAFILFVHLGGRWGAPPVVRYWAMVDDNIYKGLSPVGNLRTITPIGQVSSFAT